MGDRDWSALKKCCYCISLTIGTKAIASFFLLLTLGKTRNIHGVDGDINLPTTRIVQPLSGEAGGGESLHPGGHVRNISLYNGSC